MNNRFQEYGRSIAAGALIGVGLAVIFASGFFLRDLLEVPRLVSESNDYPLLSEVKLLVDRFYLRDVPDETAQEYGVIRGWLGALGDANTYFIPPAVAKSESEALAGVYGGIGVQVQRPLEGDRYVLIPIADGPGALAGVEMGDVLLQVNDQQVTIAMQQDEVDQLLRGEVKDDNGVNLTVRRIDGEEMTLFVPFGLIYTPSVFWRTLPEAPEIGYMQITLFSARTPEEVEQAASELRAAGIRALVLDLRNNGGGLLMEAIEVADAFLDESIITIQINPGSEQSYSSEAGGVMVDLPLVVLTNEFTASASEILAGAIRDSGRGILIGRKTFGKGTIQQIYALSDESSVHITTAEWLTPARGVIEGQGLEPDLLIEPDESGHDGELLAAINHLAERLQTQ